MSIYKLSELVNTSRTFLDRIIAALSFCAAVGTFLLMFLISTDVCVRAVFGDHIPGSLDLSQIILVFVIFIPLAYVEKSGGHLSITLLVSRLSKRANSVIGNIYKVLVIGVFGLMTRMTFKAVCTSLSEHDTSWGELAIPLWIPKAFIFLGCLIFFLSALLEVVFRIVSYIESYRS
jgi:TRAP-type C4-dicarboxylate transport system permease small subunit